MNDSNYRHISIVPWSDEDLPLVESCDFEYPPGNLLRCNDWQLDLFAAD